MELLTPEAYKRLYNSKSMQEITDELKRVETMLSEFDAEDAFGTKPSMIMQNAEDISFENQINSEDGPQIEITDEDKVQSSSSGERSQKSMYMTYQRILTTLIKEKSDFMNDTEFKIRLRNMNADDLMKARNQLVDDINKYYKETNAMRTKNMLMAFPFTRWMVKNKNVNENTESLEIIMKKEEYVAYIEQLQADPKHFEDLVEKQMKESGELDALSDENQQKN